MSTNCIYPTVCFPCIASRRINEIADLVAKENRMPTNAELDEAAMFQNAMLADVAERSHKRDNILTAISMGIL